MPSEFGSGIVVCLAKFSEHLFNPFMERYVHAQWWANADQAKRDSWLAEAEMYPTGDSARIIGHARSTFLGIRDSEEAELLSALAMWANGASDHFYDLDEKAPQELKDLAEFALDLGHGSGMFGDWPLSADDTNKKVYELWQAACIAVDKMLGVEADWGEW